MFARIFFGRTAFSGHFKWLRTLLKSWLLLCKRGGNSKQLTNQPFAGTTELKRIFSLLLSGIVLSGVAFAQSNVATQQVSINVAEIAVIAVQGNVSMTINAATAGQAPDAANASATYAITTNGTKKKITAQLDSNMPSGLTLSATMAAPSGASSAGKKALSDKSVDLVTNVTKVRGSGLSLSYEAVATVEADVANTSRTVTYTITNN